MAEQIVADYTRIYLGRGLDGEPLAAPDSDQIEISVNLDDLGEEFETAMRFPEHLLVGEEADRPDAAAVPAGALYSATDTGIVYQSDGSTWAAWATSGTGGGDGGGAAPTDTAGWMPLTTVLGGVPDLVWDASDSLIPTYTPF
jgi:hypothetical protein